MNRLQEQYESAVRKELQDSLKITSTMAVPKIEKVVLNAGLGKSINDSSYIDAAVDVLARITGQQPVKTLAKKSISNFKIREGMVVGAKVTLRGEAMYAFLDKLVNVALPRVRDFRGIPRTSFDGCGNYSLGFKEHIVFPEILSDDVEQLVGMEINVVTTATSDADALALLEKLGFPFEQIDQKN